MKPKLSCRWVSEPAQARLLQLELRDRIELVDRLGRLRYVAGADLALDDARNQAIGGIIVYCLPSMEEVERVWAARPLRFPYIPGLLSFREMPTVLAAFEKVRHEPDLIFYDGHGFAHPRRFGIACHLGLLLDRPTIGCAKSRLIGTHEEPGPTPGSWAPLKDKGETIGAVLRTRVGVKPIYVSQGHRVTLQRAIELTLAVSSGYRIPRPTRDADHFVAAIKRSRV